MKITECRYRSGPVVLVSRKIAYTFPLSYAYLAGYLKEKGENVRILFRDSDPKTLVKQILETNPVLVGFGSLYPEMEEIRGLIKLLDQAGRKFPVAIGGQMVTPSPEFAVEITGADFGIIGEGEIILHQLVTALRSEKDIHNIKGIVIRQGNTCLSNGPGDYIKNLENLPQIPYDLFPEEDWLPIGRWYAANVPQPQWRFNDRVINIHGGRGCPYNCNFCYHHSKPRYRSVHQMIAEAANALRLFDANMLYFSDDLVLATPKRAKQLVDAIRLFDLKIEYSVSTRFDILDKLDDNLLHDMKKTGCRTMGLGIESGSDRILKLIGKNCTTEMILKGLKRLKNVGILPTVSIMIGQHTETREDAEASVELMRKTVEDNPNIQYAFTITTPFPGSRLYETIFEKGCLRTHREFYEKYFSASAEWSQVVNLSDMTDEEVLFMYKKITKAYSSEKTKVLGRKVLFLKFLQTSLGIIGKIVNEKLFPMVPKCNFSQSLLRIFNSNYDLLLNKMDDLRLKFEGIAV